MFSLTEKVKAAAIGQWSFILRTTCGLTTKQTTPTKKGMPCPHCGGNDRYEFKSAEDGYYMCRGCNAGDGFTMVMKQHNCSFNDALNIVADSLGISEGSSSSLLALEAKKMAWKEANASRLAIEKNKAREVADKAERAFAQYQPATSANPYLQNKSSTAFGVRESASKLVIPARNINGEITSLQFINENGDKRFMPGGKIKASFHLIGQLGSLLCIAEGYATGASFYEYSKRKIPVAIAFNAGNLKAVAEAFKEKHPDLEIVIVGDNDRFTKGNPGKAKAIEAAEAVGGKYFIPKFEDGEPGTDFNDWINLRRNRHGH